MKRSKQICTVLLLLANIMLMVHSVLPHTHHDGLICVANKTVGSAFPDMKCNNNDCCWHHLDDDNNVKHENADTCDLQDQLQRVDRDGNEEVIYFLSTSTLLFTTLPEHSNCFCFHSRFLDKELEPTKPYIDNYSSPYLYSSLGLRAPPANFLG